jgi:hypothetical protein
MPREARRDLRLTEMQRRGPKRPDHGVVDARDRHANAAAAEVLERRQRRRVAHRVLQEGHHQRQADDVPGAEAREHPVGQRARESRTEQRLVGDQERRLQRLQAPDAKLVPRGRLDHAEVIAAVAYLLGVAHGGVGRVAFAGARDQHDVDAALRQPPHLIGEERGEEVVVLVVGDPQRQRLGPAARLVGSARAARAEQTRRRGDRGQRCPYGGT